MSEQSYNNLGSISEQIVEGLLERLTENPDFNTSILQALRQVATDHRFNDVESVKLALQVSEETIHETN